MGVLIHKRAEGHHGTLEAVNLGAPIGQVAHWTATRRANNGPEAEYWDLHAVFSWITPALFNDKDIPNQLTLQQTRRSRSYIVRPIEGPGQRTALNGRSLIMERVALDGSNDEGNAGQRSSG
jgi:hypothetical protein